jgi:hypothetical protein
MKKEAGKHAAYGFEGNTDCGCGKVAEECWKSDQRKEENQREEVRTTWIVVWTTLLTLRNLWSANYLTY